VIAWRVFVVYMSDVNGTAADLGLLRSPMGKSRWDWARAAWPSRHVKATCPKKHGDRRSCRCGIYACRSVESLSQLRAVREKLPTAVLAPVRLEGDVWTSPDRTDPPGSVRGDAATLLGPLYVNPSPAASQIRQALTDRYGLPTVLTFSGCRPIAW